MVEHRYAPDPSPTVDRRSYAKARNVSLGKPSVCTDVDPRYPRVWDLGFYDAENYWHNGKFFALYVPLVDANASLLKEHRRELVSTYFHANGKAKARQFLLRKSQHRNLWPPRLGGHVGDPWIRRTDVWVWEPA